MTMWFLIFYIFSTQVIARLLVIDEDRDFRLLLCNFLRRADYSVTESKDGLGGLKRARVELLDLIITNTVVPNQDGIGTIMSLRNDFPDIKIVAISGGGNWTTRRLQLSRQK